MKIKSPDLYIGVWLIILLNSTISIKLRHSKIFILAGQRVILVGMSGAGNSSRWLGEAALNALRSSPRVNLKSLRPPINYNEQVMKPRSQQGGKSKGFGRDQQNDIASYLGIQ